MDVVVEVVRGLLPTAGVLLLFGLAIRAIVRADAAERAGRARVEADEDAAVAADAVVAADAADAVVAADAADAADAAAHPGTDDHPSGESGPPSAQR